jgi:hypothetical protein
VTARRTVLRTALAAPLARVPGRPAPVLEGGTLVTLPAHAATEVRAGVRHAMQEVVWARFDPAQVEREFRALTAAGKWVTLGTGIHYRPEWAAGEYVDQAGRIDRGLDLVSDPAAREWVAGYYGQLAKVIDFGQLYAVRLTSGAHAGGEMLYPDRWGFYWAYGRRAQTGCPLPGWRPGQRALPIDVAHWLDWYLTRLADTISFQRSVLDGLGFRGQYQIVTPGSGTRPSGVIRDIESRLTAATPTSVGAVWHWFYGLIDRHRACVYVSSVADGSGGNDLGQPSDAGRRLDDPALDAWSSVRWQARIAHEYGMPVSGENTGYGEADHDFYRTRMPEVAVAQARSCGLRVLYWAHDERLWDGTVDFQRFADLLR